ncbi:secernin-1 [Bactrocera neohumeralis]|uniref:secernin-1 n=1 Tax=Bactrocera tryoni TaxID=59916 RepID=UPI001A97A4B6|nr:secernin-1 [Bactrocera tryoni]XP_050335251.1 secernin-1 [Bactrocera neohumeralis]
MSATGDCFIIQSPNTAENTIIFGRNALDADALTEAQEVQYYNANFALEGKPDGGADVVKANGEILRMILQKTQTGIWGGDVGANDHNVCIAVSWSAEEPANDSDTLRSTDIVRLTLAIAKTAVDAVERIGNLVANHGSDNAKFSFVVCDTKEVWLVSSGAKLWAAHQVADGFLRLTNKGLSVKTAIDKSTDDLGDALKSLGLWDGEGDLNFASCFDAAETAEAEWSGEEPKGDGSYTLTSMFDTLRSAADSATSRSASVSVLTNGISCHWFTATPNASESVFKPFVFAPNPKISPLTKVPPDNTHTLLHKLHAQRKPNAVEDLKALEAACVDELNAYLAEHPTADEELDELMKDCVEAEVKFYR